MALELRGFNSGRVRSTYQRARPAPRDAVAALGAVAVAGAYLALRAHGVGTLVRSP